MLRTLEEVKMELAMFKHPILISRAASLEGGMGKTKSSVRIGKTSAPYAKQGAMYVVVSLYETRFN